MRNLVQGQTLWCSMYDPAGLITATTMSLLRDHAGDQPMQIQLAQAESPERVLGDPSQPLGLAVWHVTHVTELLAVCRALAVGVAGDRRRSLPVRLVFLSRELSSHYAAVVESGAQIVVCDVPSLVQAVSAIWDRLPLSEQGFHPLTSGLIQRLPWPELAD